MGNYPFESGYMLNGNGLLPAFPVRVACQALMDTYATERGLQPLVPTSQVRLAPLACCVCWAPADHAVRMTGRTALTTAPRQRNQPYSSVA